MARRNVENTVTQAADLATESSSDESDDTVIRTELIKQPAEPDLEFESDGEESSSLSSSADSNLSRNVVEDGELGDDETSNPNPQVDIETNEQNPGGLISPPQPSPEAEIQPSQIDKIKPLAPAAPPCPVPTTQPTVSKSTKSAPEQQVAIPTSAAMVSAEVREEIEQELLVRIKEPEKTHKIVTSELKKRKRILKQKVKSTDKKHVSAMVQDPPSNHPANPANSEASNTNLSFRSNVNGPSTSAQSSMAKIPKLILDMGIVRMSMEKVASRKRLANSYSVLSEILLVKQILAGQMPNGNPLIPALECTAIIRSDGWKYPLARVDDCRAHIAPPS